MMFVLTGAALKLNAVLKELHLGENSLNIHDAIQLGALLKHNNTLQLLDVRYRFTISNFII